MSTQPPSINFEPVKKWLVYIISILALIVSVVTAINSALPNQIGEPPIVVTNQGVTNLDDLTLSGALTADSVTADTVTATTLVSQSVEFEGTTADLTGALTADSGAFTGTVTAGYLSATDVTGTLSTAAQPNVTSLGSISNLTTTNASITGSVTISGFTQYPFVFFGNDSAVNGTMIEHGRGQTLTYPWCMVYDAAWVTATARISATNSTSVTLAIFGTDGEPWTSPAVPVRCGAVYVP